MADSFVDSTKEKIFPCPVCRKSTRYHTGNLYRPFCSERCRMIDLGLWLEEDYRVAGEQAHHDQTGDE